MKKTPRNLIVVSDTHCGCRLGLLHPNGARVDSGGVYKPSKFQQQTYALWREFFDVWVPEVTRGEAYDLVHNGMFGMWAVTWLYR